MDATTVVGFIAGVLTTVSFLPQVLKTVKTRLTRDISLGMYLILAIGISMWFVYGILMNSLPVILANGVGIILAGVVIGFKLKYK